MLQGLIVLLSFFLFAAIIEWQNFRFWRIHFDGWINFFRDFLFKVLISLIHGVNLRAYGLYEYLSFVLQGLLVHSCLDIMIQGNLPTWQLEI